MRIIEITVSPKGEATVQTKGYLGENCMVASKFLEAALGQAVAEQKTPEYYQTQPIEQIVRQ